MEEQQKELSQEEYMQTEVRRFPLGDCWVNADWEEQGMASVIVTRRKSQNAYILGLYHVDPCCIGVKDSAWTDVLDEQDYEYFLEGMNEEGELKKITYEEAHNIIYGAIAFAKKGGIDPDSSFDLMKYILKEDTEDIPKIAYEFGKNGKHVLFTESSTDLSEYVPKLRAALGDDFQFSLLGMEEVKPGSEYDAWKAAADLAGSFFSDEGWEVAPSEEYSYVNGEFPTSLSLHYGWLEDLLYAPKNDMLLSGKDLDRVLALPHEELRADLEQILLYETGRTCGELTNELCDEVCKRSVLLHCLLLLGELGNPASLPTVLVLLCQDIDCVYCNLGDRAADVLVPTLYLLGKDRLDELMRYMQTPGLCADVRIRVPEAMVMLALRNPERRDEVIDWFRTLLVFYDGKLETNECCDGIFIGMITDCLIDLYAVELLPELKKLYDTDLVDKYYYRNFKVVEEEITLSGEPWNFPVDIRKRYDRLYRKRYRS